MPLNKQQLLDFLEELDEELEREITVVAVGGTATIDGVYYFLTWHAVLEPEYIFQCKYPEIIQHSLNHTSRGYRK